MAFVSRNPKIVLNPETAENCISVEAKNLTPGQEFIGYYKNQYTDPVYNNKCYVFKGKEDGQDYLFYGAASLHNEMVYFSQGDLVSVIYKGQHENKKGPFAGKLSHIWKVTGEDTWIPSPEFIAELQQEVFNRRVEVQKQLSNPRGINTPSFTAPVSVAPLSSNTFSSPKKSINPFG